MTIAMNNQTNTVINTPINIPTANMNTATDVNTPDALPYVPASALDYDYSNTVGNNVDHVPLGASVDLGIPGPLTLEGYEPSTWHVMKTAAAQAWEYNPMVSIYNLARLNMDASVVFGSEARGGRFAAERGGLDNGENADNIRISAQEMTPAVPKLEIEEQRKIIEEHELSEYLKPHESYSKETLEYIIENKKLELARGFVQDKSSGWQLPFSLLSMLGTSLIDPINVVSAFIPAVSEARALSMMRTFRHNYMGRRLAQMGIGASNAAVGAALVEPLIYTAQQQMQADYNFTNSLLNIGFGAIFGATITPAVGAFKEFRYKRTGKFFEWQSELSTPESLRLMKQNARNFTMTRMAANPDLDMKVVYQQSMEDAMVLDAAMRRFAYQQHITPEEAYRKGEFALLNGEYFTQRMEAKVKEYDNVTKIIKEIEDRVDKGAPPYLHYIVLSKLKSKLAKLNDEILDATQGYTDELEVLFGTDANTVFAIGKRSNLKDINMFVKEITKRPSEGRVHFDFGRTISRIGSENNGCQIIIKDKGVGHIMERHSDFREWDEFLDVIANGEEHDIGPDDSTGGQAYYYTKELDNKRSMAVLGVNYTNKQDRKLFQINTAFVNTTEKVNRHVANKKARAASKNTNDNGVRGEESGVNNAPRSNVLEADHSANDGTSYSLSTDQNPPNSLLPDSPTKVKPEGDGKGNGSPGNDTLYQRNDAQRILGSYTESKDFRRVIRIFREHDSTTMPHELAHVLESMYRQYAMSPDAKPELVAAYNNMKKIYGVAEDGKWTVAQRESFAEDFVKYIHSGKSPNINVTPAFEAMKQRAMDIYGEADAAGLQITNEVRSIFNDMLSIPINKAEAMFHTALLDLSTRRFEQELMFNPKAIRRTIYDPVGLSYEPSQAQAARNMGIDPAQRYDVPDDIADQITMLTDLNNELTQDIDIAMSHLTDEERARLKADASEEYRELANLEKELSEIQAKQKGFEKYLACVL